MMMRFFPESTQELLRTRPPAERDEFAGDGTTTTWSAAGTAMTAPEGDTPPA